MESKVMVKIRRIRERREELLDSRGDEPAILIAGENSEVVLGGTFRQCHDALWKVPRYPRDSYSGWGCWTIISKNIELPAENELMSGKFNGSYYTYDR